MYGLIADTLNTEIQRQFDIERGRNEDDSEAGTLARRNAVIKANTFYRAAERLADAFQSDPLFNRVTFLQRVMPR